MSQTHLRNESHQRALESLLVVQYTVFCPNCPQDVDSTSTLKTRPKLSREAFVEQVLLADRRAMDVTVSLDVDAKHRHRENETPGIRLAFINTKHCNNRKCCLNTY